MVRPISEVRKPEIVQGAIKALNKRGLSMISYDLIAEEADMSRQLIRHYFPDVESLMISVCDALAAAHKEALAQGIVTTDARERLPVFLDVFFDLLADKGVHKPEQNHAYDAMMAIAAGHEKVRQALRDQQSLLQHTIAHEVQISYPDLSQEACGEIGFLFVSLLYGHWRLVATLGFDDSYNRISRSAIDRLIESYRQSYTDPNLGEPPK